MAALTLLRSRKLIAPFAVHAPTTVENALQLKATISDARFMAGGIELADQLKNGISYSDLIRLDAIPELNSISLQNGHLHIGAATPHRLVSQHPLIRRHLPSFADAVASIGSPRIRTQGTIGGNLMTGAWHYDMLPMLMALSARVTLATADSVRHEHPIEAVMSSQPSDLLVSIIIPVGDKSSDFWFQRVDKPVQSLSVARSIGNADSFSFSVVLACTSHQPILRTVRSGAESNPEEQVKIWRESLVELRDDHTSSAWYRAELAEIRLRRMLSQAMGGRP